ncbi:MAG: metallophosphoesterase [Lachnospiraceae bacterium]|nr:metallophosphoesterase [Lachnospiraceae bacterium]
MTVLFTADLHLGHEKILTVRDVFHNIDEHDNVLIDKWNAKVKKNDEVYILGDLSFRSPRHISYYLSRMKGRKHLIVGNHDGHWMRHVEQMNVYFESVDYLKTIKLDKKQITLCHYPMLEWPGSRCVETETSYLIHGHIHSAKDSKVYGHIKEYQPHSLNAGVDINHYEPVTFEELKENNACWYERK